MTGDHSSHAHGAGHSHAPVSGQRFALWFSVGANSVLLAVQVVVGLLIGSLALLADSLHNASDVVALVIALIGQALAARPPTSRRTYGLARAEILAALLNGTVLIALTGWVVVEAVRRFSEPVSLDAAPLAVIGVIGLAVNGGSAWMLSRAGGTNLNMRAAFWHLVADALGSFGVVIAAAGVYFFDAGWVDPAVSILISVLVLVGVWRLLRDTVGVLLESTPAGLDVDEVGIALAEVDGISSAHHVHIWSVDSQTVAMTAHLDLVDGGSLHGAQQVLANAKAMLAERFDIDHATLEPECHTCDTPEHRT
jgi:cobalt-zinc-cadmium efflux system protein